mgnify:CR=1 FL=1|tara:strand:- start:552 stop:833 length:282 start_codon:yes stop_codon:yes gene_type:complete
MYKKIYNPNTKKYVNIDSKLGKNIIKRYSEKIGGATDNDEPRSIDDRVSTIEQKLAVLETNLMEGIARSRGVEMGLEQRLFELEGRVNNIEEW